ncbi:BLUF domain-containing protein [Roseibaca sp. V10]|uniref:BLUF domain-containing protein n=2 Tax=Roseinatronobacter TaxID=121820 RepID=A0ABT0M0H1_9RHOB|nr:BLUF domain-containing protein [Roseibaca domitiana]MCL1627895.1 BLUF domain-containing protein [Roseibaca domitiana]
MLAQAAKGLPMSVYRAIYTSRPFGFDSNTLNSILVHAQHANPSVGITGALICREDVYLQLLEGPEDAVRNVMERIRRDDRHVEFQVHVEHTVPERMFGKWAMLHDPAATWIWSRSEVRDDAIERTTEAEVEGFFERLRDKMDTAGAGMSD